MAYASYNIATAKDVRDAIADFASQQGWQVTATGDSIYRIKRPDDAGAAEFVLARYTNSHLVDRLIVVTADPDNNNIDAVTDIGMYSRNTTLTEPIWGGGASVVRLHGEMGDSPWIFASVECSQGSFRNLAFGHLKKLGDYQGGEYYSTSSRDFYSTSGSGSWSGTGGINRCLRAGYFNDSAFSYTLFGAMLGYINANYAPGRGAVRIDGTWYPYKGQAIADPSNAYSIVGAPPSLSPIKAPRIGVNAFSGHAPMIPINHYWGNTTRGTSASGFWVPIGYPDGIVSVDMTNFFPLQQVTLADNSVWRIYPSIRKGSMTQSNDEETSGPYGYAVRESFG